MPCDYMTKYNVPIRRKKQFARLLEEIGAALDIDTAAYWSYRHSGLSFCSGPYERCIAQYLDRYRHPTRIEIKAAREGLELKVTVEKDKACIEIVPPSKEAERILALYTAFVI
jgi:hypothetical protein